MPDEGEPVTVREVALNPRWRLVEVRIDGLAEALLVLRIEHYRLGNVDAILSKPNAMLLRDTLNEVLAQAKVPA